MSPANTGWRIKRWSRELGGGGVESPGADDLPFDASVALVDDFTISEDVSIELKGTRGSWRVTKVWPASPRFRRPRVGSLDAPNLDPDLASAAAATLAAAPACLGYRMASLGDDLVIHGDYQAFAHGHEIEVTFHGVGYIELPKTWPGKGLRLADRLTRIQVARRCKVTNRTIVVEIQADDGDGPCSYFVACASISCAPGPRSDAPSR